MSNPILNRLYIEDRKLAAKEAYLTKMLEQIKNEKAALNIEKLQLNSILRDLEKKLKAEERKKETGIKKESATKNESDNESSDSSYEHFTNTQLLDEAGSSINTGTLNLAISNNDDMIMQVYMDEVESDCDELL